MKALLIKLDNVIWRKFLLAGILLAVLAVLSSGSTASPASGITPASGRTRASTFAASVSGR